MIHLSVRLRLILMRQGVTYAATITVDCLTGNEVRRAVAASPSGFREGVAA